MTNIRISRLDDAEGDINTADILAALELDDMDEMSPAELETKAYADKGIIPNKIAAANAGSFGIKKAYFDVWKPVDETKKGIWHLQKDADGGEWIVRADSE